MERVKIESLESLGERLEQERAAGRRIVQCHGVFDLLHPGHIRHFRAARAQGDRLVVTVTPDRFVNKGPGRPVFPEALRLEALAALEVVDYVALNATPDAVFAIQAVRPNIYVKGIEYQDHATDVTGKISEEVRAVEEIGGAVHYTDDIVFSSSTLLNRHFDAPSPEVTAFLTRLKERHSLEGLLRAVEQFKDLNVLVIGDAIIDEYQYTEPLGTSGKGLHLVARAGEKNFFLGGSLIIANHLASFVKNVTLVTAIGENCPYRPFIERNLDRNVTPEWFHFPKVGTLVKKRYVLKDGPHLTKLFEVYSGAEQSLGPERTQSIISWLDRNASQFNLVVACDFANGFTTPPLIDAISSLPVYIALNTQTNSGNRGFNIVTNYQRADYISLNEPEVRLAAHDKTSSLEGIVADICQLMQCEALSVTRGVSGALCYSAEGESVVIPPFASRTIDRIGAGDSYLALSALCMAKGMGMEVAGFFGSLAAAMSVQVVGNAEAIQKGSFCKFLTRLLK